MEGKTIKEESVSVGSPCSPLSLPSGKENRRVGSPLTNTEILTRSRSKVLSKENSSHHHHHHHLPHHHRMSESPKASGVGNGSPSPPVSSVNLTVTANKSSSSSGGGGTSSHLGHSSGCGSSSSSAAAGSSSLGAFHHFSSPHSTTAGGGGGSSSSSNSNGPSSGPIPNGSSVLRNSGRTPSPTLNHGSTLNGVSARDRDVSATTTGSSSSSTGRTPTSSSNNSSGGSANSMGHGNGNSRLLVKIKRFLGTLLHFGCDISPDVGERVRTLVFNLVSGHLSIEEFHHTLQEVTSFPLRPFVLPFLRAHLPLLQREISHLARLAKQTPLTYVQGHEQVIIDTGSSPGEPCDIFHSEASDLSLPGKRKASESFYENGELSSESSSGYASAPKRHHGSGSIFSPPFFLASAASSTSDFRDFYGGGASGYGGGHQSIPGSQHHLNHSSSSSSHHHESLSGGGGGGGPGTPSNGMHCQSGGGKGGPEDEWKNIHVMLNCILSMVEKTKRALGILQSRTAHTEQSEGASSSSWLRRPSMYSGIESSEDIKRQVGEMMAQAFRATEDRVSEVKRRAEEAVQEVKRQALVELKRAVAAAEARACEAVASERARLERVLLDSRRGPGEICSSIVVGASIPVPIESEACWNCGRKAHETCSGCNTARYCSSFCQHKDWENHHAVCGRSSSTNSERASGSSSGGGGGSSGAAIESKNNSHPHPHEHSNSSPINVSNPSPENPSPNSNN